MKHIFKLIFIFLLSFTSLNIYAEENIKFVIDTSKGNIVIETYPKKAPITVKNFESYVNKGFYNNTIFHRVIDGFMIQGGGFTKDMAQKQTDAPIQNEASNGLKNEKYSVAMARTQDPDSASSQFFINVNNNNFLDYARHDGAGYCVLGKVIEGQAVVYKIAKVTTGSSGMHQDVPNEPVIIEEASV